MLITVNKSNEYLPEKQHVNRNIFIKFLLFYDTKNMIV